MIGIVRGFYRDYCHANGLQVGTHPENVAAFWMHRAGFPFVQQHRVGRYRLDFAVPKVLAAIEVDGWHHESPEGAARDAARDRWLRANGWLVFRVTDADDLIEQLIRVMVCVRGLIERGADPDPYPMHRERVARARRLTAGSAS